MMLAQVWVQGVGRLAGDGDHARPVGVAVLAVAPACARELLPRATPTTRRCRPARASPDSVSEHPTVFVTLTAPSFGAVHSRRVSGDRAHQCRPRRHAEVCPHGTRISCGEVHETLGWVSRCARSALTTRDAVLWNAMAPEPWRRTSIQIPRELARLAGLSQCGLRRRARVSYVKVAEYQRRGSLHFHVVIRLDGAQPRDLADRVELPDSEFSAELLTGQCARPSLTSRSPLHLRRRAR
jgi:hypothetical protein